MPPYILKKAMEYLLPYLLPIIKDYFEQILHSVLAKYKTKFDNTVDKTWSNNQEKANHKIHEAELSARNASTDSEKEKYQAVASAWREVAEEFRIENEALKAKIEELTAMAETEIIKRTGGLDSEINVSTDKLLLGNDRK